MLFSVKMTMILSLDFQMIIIRERHVDISTCLSAEYNMQNE
jgi:hypothetical protein